LIEILKYLLPPLGMEWGMAVGQTNKCVGKGTQKKR